MILSFAVANRCSVTCLQVMPLRFFRRYQHLFAYESVLRHTAASAYCSSSRLLSIAESAGPKPDDDVPCLSDDVPLLLAEGLFAVNKPLNWTSSDVVARIRNTLQKDTKARGGTVASIKSKGKRKMTVGHGGTLDPLATGVLVIGVGTGTKQLETFLAGSKMYCSRGEFGFETTTLDMGGEVTKNATYNHITVAAIEEILPAFTGEIEQIPPIFSALKRNGKKLYELGRKGLTAEDIGLKPRPTTIYNLKLVNTCDDSLPTFHIDVECAGGTYVRSLIRDIGYKLDSVATMTLLTRTQQGPFTLDDVIHEDDWTPTSIYAAIERSNAKLASMDVETMYTSISEP